MQPSTVWHLIQWLHYLGLSLWIGGIVFFSAIAAPSAHRSMASKAIAGEIVGKMLARFNSVEITCTLLLLVTSVSSFRFIQERKEWLGLMIAVIFLMGAVVLFYAYPLTARLETLKEKIPTLEVLSASNSAKKEFDRLHHLYVRLMSLSLVLGLAVLYGSVILLK